MKKPLKIVLIVFGITAIISMIWIASILFVFTGVHPYVPDLVYSMDGSMVIIPSINYNKTDMNTYLEVNIEIHDTQSKKTLYQVQTHASDRMKWSIHWVDKDTFQLDSSDIGTYCWKLENQTWSETDCPEKLDVH